MWQKYLLFFLKDKMWEYEVFNWLLMLNESAAE